MSGDEFILINKTHLGVLRIKAQRLVAIIKAELVPDMSNMEIGN